MSLLHRNYRAGGATTVSLVVPVHGVEAYLPRFLASLDAQTHRNLQVVLVLDGAVDECPRICREWADRTDLDALVVWTTNGGQGRARNLGLEHATGEWIGFPDPDDEIEPEFVEALLEARGADEGAAMLIGRTLIHQSGGLIMHPLDFRFRHGVRAVDVREAADVIQLSTTACLVRAEEAHACRFPEDREAPTFEDGLYVGRVRALNPRCVLVPGAIYRYEKRGAGDSTVQTAWQRPGRYTSEITDRYLPYLDETGCARWAQETVLYDLGWCFGVVDRGLMPDVPGLAEEHEALMRELVLHLDEDVIALVPWSHLSARARARMLLWKGLGQVVVVHAGRVVELFTSDPVGHNPRPARYAGITCGWVLLGTGAEAYYAGGSVPRLPLQSPQPYLGCPKEIR